MSFLGIDPKGDCKPKRDGDLYDSSQISQQQKTDPLPVKLGESVRLALKAIERSVMVLWKPLNVTMYLSRLKETLQENF